MGLHFEWMNRALQRERIDIVYKPGPLSKEDRARLREIHSALGNEPVARMDRTKMDFVLKRGAAAMAVVRDEMLSEARDLAWIDNAVGAA